MQRIFIGDVQGCGNELETLVERAEAAFGDDFSLWVAGDLVNRGPLNLGPLKRVRKMVEAGRAEYVLGNHEIFLLEVAFGLRELRPTDSVQDVLSAPDVDDWIEWLRRRPVVVPGEIDGQPFAMVHAASSPDWDLSELSRWGEAVQARLGGDLDEARAFLALSPDEDETRNALARLTRCRRIGSDGVWSSEEPEGPEFAWHKAWLDRGHDFGLVYGHWARQGLHVVKGLRGLDTGCVHHGRGKDGFLTGWMPEAPKGAAGAGGSREGLRSFDAPDDRLWQIPAERRYYYAAGEDDPAGAGGPAGG
ncbi:MAG: metallophosphoesterase [Myxococcota bacterium]